MGGAARTGVFGRIAQVLVVDDDEQIREALAELLRANGYDVGVAHDGVTAVEMAVRRAPLALLVTDIDMPGIGGRELARRLRADFSELPVLLISGSPTEATRQKHTADPRTRFLAKPFSVEAFLDSVVELIGET